MFVRVDKDLYINIQNIFSYKLIDDGDAYKLQIWSSNGNLVHNIFYIKDNIDQMKILLEFNNMMRDLMVNPEIVSQHTDLVNEVAEPEEKHIKEKLELDEDDVF